MLDRCLLAIALTVLVAAGYFVESKGQDAESAISLNVRCEADD